MPAVFGDVSFLMIHVSLVFIGYILYVVLRMKEKTQLHYAFLFLMFSVFLWVLGAIFLAYDDLYARGTRAAWVYLSYIGLILTPMAILYLGLTFSQSRVSISWKTLLLWVVPVVSIVVLLTNDRHHLFYRYLRYEDLTQARALGNYFLVHTLYSYACIIVGMGYLVTFSIKNAGFFSRQSMLIVSGMVISFGYNILLTLQVIPGFFYHNAIAFFITTAFFYLAIFKYDFLNVSPIALQRVVDHISDSFLVIDRNLVLADYNRTFTGTFGDAIPIRRKDRLDQVLESGVLAPEARSLMETILEKSGEGEGGSMEWSLEMGGTRRFFSVEITPLMIRNVFFSTIVLLKEITQVKEAMTTIQKNYEILTEQERLASLGQLIGGIAHNLKTPIMSISGGIEGLADLVEEYDSSIGDPQVTPADHREIAAEMSQWLEKMRPHCSYMSEIISTVKGQAVQFSTSSMLTFTLDELIKRVDLLMRHELKRFHCRLNIRFETDRFLEIRGDVGSLVQIFDNLIINAIHSYDGRQGEIDLTISSRGDQVLFSFRDYGKGIPLPIQERLFREMVTTKGKMGTGLGLYMSYASVKGRFEGNLWFESEPGRGTTFFVSLPCATPARETESTSPMPGTSGNRGNLPQNLKEESSDSPPVGV